MRWGREHIKRLAWSYSFYATDAFKGRRLLTAPRFNGTLLCCTLLSSLSLFYTRFSFLLSFYLIMPLLSISLQTKPYNRTLWTLTHTHNALMYPSSRWSESSGSCEEFRCRWRGGFCALSGLLGDGSEAQTWKSSDCVGRPLQMTSTALNIVETY